MAPTSPDPMVRFSGSTSHSGALMVTPEKSTVWPEVSTCPVASISPWAVVDPPSATRKTLPSLVETPVALMIEEVLPARA